MFIRHAMLSAEVSSKV